MGIDMINERHFVGRGNVGKSWNETLIVKVVVIICLVDFRVCDDKRKYN